MITIKKDGDTVICSKNTFESMFKRLGYKIVNENQKIKQIEKPQKEETQEEKIVEIPVIETKKDTNVKNKNKK